MFLQHVYFSSGRETQSFRLFPQHVTTAVVPTYLGTLIFFKLGMVLLMTTMYPYPLGQRNTIHNKIVLFCIVHSMCNHRM